MFLKLKLKRQLLFLLYLIITSNVQMGYELIFGIISSYFLIDIAFHINQEHSQSSYKTCSVLFEKKFVENILKIDSQQENFYTFLQQLT